MLTASALVARLGGRLWIGVYRCTLAAMLVRVLVWSLVFARAPVCVRGGRWLVLMCGYVFIVCRWQTSARRHV